MKKNRFLFMGMAVLFLVAMVGFVSCNTEADEDEKYTYEWVLKNSSSHTIVVAVTSSPHKPKNFKIRPNAEARVGSNTNETLTFTWKRKDTNTQTGAYYNSMGILLTQASIIIDV